MTKSALFCLIAFGTVLCFGQEKKTSSSFTFKIDNDFFNITGRGTDRYYSDGFFLGFKSQVLKKNIFDRLMVSTKNTDRIREFYISHQMYTPHHIGNPNLQVGDYPYAALLALNYSNLTLKQTYAYYSQITIGVQGPMAGGKEIQTFLHKRVFHSNVPLGWKYQLPNDLAFKYTIGFEMRIWNEDIVDITCNTQANLGLLANNFKIGTTVKIGRFKDYFTPEAHLFIRDKNVSDQQVFFTVSPYISFVQSNSLLEGGAFKSGGGAWGTYNAIFYHIDRSQLERIVYGYSWGFHYIGKSFSAAYFQNFYSAEIKGLNGHVYGTIQLQFKL